MKIKNESEKVWSKWKITKKRNARTMINEKVTEKKRKKI